MPKFPSALVALAAAFACAAHAASDASPMHIVPVDQLKLMYLDCDRMAGADMLDAADASRCSAIYEALLGRAFDGDFGRLMQWWSAQRASARICTDPRRTPGPERCDQG